MRSWIRPSLAAGLVLAAAAAVAQPSQRVIDIPTRPGVTQRVLVLTPAEPKAAVVLVAGGHGGLQIFPGGSMGWGANNFVVRTRQAFADLGLVAVVVDAPSDRQSPPYLGGVRQRPEHAEDFKAVIQWVRETAKVPVWLVGTSRGTQSVAYVAATLASGEGPDGVVLTSSILADPRSRPLPAMPLGRIRVPVLVVHHELDGCDLCAFADVGKLMDGLRNAPRKELMTFRGGVTQGNPCEAMAYHGYNGIESEVVQKIAGWILAR